MSLKFKRLSETAVIPTRGSVAAAGLDLYSDMEFSILAGGRERVLTNVAVEIPTNCYGRVAPRSGLAWNFGIDVGAGVIDSDYRGNIMVILFNFGSETYTGIPGDKIAQLIIEPYLNLIPIEVTELNSTARGEGGFGSTGN